MTHLRRIHSILLSATLLALSGCGTNVLNPVTGEAERSVMDEATEIAEGAKAHKQVIQDEGVYNNPKLQAYVNSVGQKLAAESHRAHLKWTFTVLDSPEINAFALPGGYIYVTRGIMAYFDSEAELAGVIGHEIGHVTARHGAQRATRQQDAGLGVLAATILGAVLESQGMRGATDIAGQVSQTAAAGYVASYSREQESQADRLGAEYLARTQYDPRNMINVIALLKNQEQLAAEGARASGQPVQTGGDWLASHPSNEQRLADIRSNATLYQGRYVDDGRDRYLQAIDGMTFGDSREQGVVRGRNFYHEPLGLALSAPIGWHIVNGKDAINVIHDAGDAALIVKLLPEQTQAMSHESIIRQLLKADQNRVEGRTERRRLQGLQATHFAGTVQNPQGQVINVMFTVADGPAGRRYLMRYTGRNGQTVQRELPAMREAESSFRAITSADRNAAKPWVIRTTSMPKGGFSELARQSALNGLDPQAEARLKLMNSAYGEAGSGGANRTPTAGRRVKTVQ